MDGVKRYSEHEFDGPPMSESSNGPWVRFQDYAALESRLLDAQVSSSLDRENLNAQLDDWRERALRCEKLWREIVPVNL